MLKVFGLGGLVAHCLLMTAPPGIGFGGLGTKRLVNFLKKILSRMFLRLALVVILMLCYLSSISPQKFGKIQTIL